MKQQQDRNNELKRLKESRNPLELLTLQPKEPITPRSWWTWFDKWAKTYAFIHVGQIPLTKIETSKSPGVFFDEDKNGMSQGKYSATYIPYWHNRKEDCYANIKLYVKEKDHPSTQIAIDKINEELGDQNIPGPHLNYQVKKLVSTLKH